MKVLVVEDDVTSRRMIEAMLMKWGYEVETAANGLEGWDRLQNEATDLAIIDFHMPVMNGVELLNRMREHRDLRDIPAVMVTAEADQEIVAEVAESEIDAYVLKPVSAKSLGDKVSEVIDRLNNPSPMVQHLKNARSLEEAEDIDGAIAEARLAMEAEPRRSRPVRELGYYCFKKNSLDEAEKWLLKAASMNRLDVFAFHQLGELYLRRDEIEKAAEYFEKAMNISPRHLERGVRFGEILVQKKMIDKAAQVFGKIFSLSDNPPELQEQIANFCLAHDAKEYAVQLLENLVRQQQDRTDLLVALGIALEEMGENAKAMPHFILAAEKDKNSIEIQLHVARNYLVLGYPLRAEQALRQVLNKEPDHAEARAMYRQCVSHPGRAV